MSQQIKPYNRITDGNIWREMLLFALPLMAGSVVQQLYTTVDTIIVGRFVGKIALAAVGGAPAIVAMIVITFFNGLSNGAAVVTAQLFGARDFEKLRESIHTAYLFAVLVSVVVTLCGIFWTPAMMRGMNTPEEMMEASVTYLRIYFTGMLFTLVYNMGSAIMRAIGDSRRPTLYLVIASLLNIVLDLIFVLVLHMGIAGAAWATVLSQMVSALLVTRSLRRAYPEVQLRFRDLRIHMPVLRRELQIGMPGALQASAYGLTNVVIQTAVNGFGTDIVAAWSAYGKLDMISWTAAGALGAAMTTFVGQNYGAGKMQRIFRCIRTGTALTYLISGSIVVILWLFCRPLYHLFTTDLTVIDLGVQMLRFLAPTYVLSFLLEALNGGLRGLGDAFWPTVFALGGLFVLRMPWILILAERTHSFEVLMLSFPVAWLGTLALLIPYYFRRKKKVLLEDTAG
ncbi:MAG: MATE family efflux transporter [Mogibacterium sp.]|nr:MATE family efflux transporter [Mogibacterium sp.]